MSKYKKLNNSFPGIVSYSDILMKKLFVVNKVAALDSTILITGGSETGEELIAKGIHEAGFRKGKSLILVNCADISPNLIESELFDHEKGLFTRALYMRKGKFEHTNIGTIFLDGIGCLKLNVQVKSL
ncbi:hypothetical protein ICM_06353 [Bacillus cereus BAG1X2-3]|uniref:Sigma-54 factor interaction domain-containing protein n=1 Tax=Bacillus cereus TaxID=1396 RepID=A0A9X7E0S5_BACCE|nr:sigma 54-interacting transcriptional regulator [Bacillus cereus]EOO24418.1 hypothetical protein ICC_05347 [Bacillus cereus BAG1X1-1]EOO43243.1 hypothetical protein ICI_05874 [Bacillus cereus BAG1X2-1]EOO44604.1 hypothetical protein ICK_06057 [Bacillus cereus BAG1X2-2]EOP00859.1 hypothetical protein ICO_05940 [Bacillus cereus BAG2O-1]EOO62768.1 hypothetical protein ICM_06353 [Bacillus cereus BAG1X2-3]